MDTRRLASLQVASQHFRTAASSIAQLGFNGDELHYYLTPTKMHSTHQKPDVQPSQPVALSCPHSHHAEMTQRCPSLRAAIGGCIMAWSFLFDAYADLRSYVGTAKGTA